MNKTFLKNADIVIALPIARNIYKFHIKTMMEDLFEINGKITFHEVKEIAAAFTQVNTAVYEALVRVIECENVITLETK